MEIQTVKIEGDGYLVNGKTLVPKSNGNKDYESVKIWLETNTPTPEFTAQELADQAMSKKWSDVNTARSTLTVETTAGNIFAANPEAILSIYRKEASMLSTDSCTWYEDVVSFTVTKVELQEALNLANAADQNLLDTLLT